MSSDYLIFRISNTNSNSFIENSKGTVVINSTMGIISLYNFKPTITLGNAIYANSGLAVSAVSNGIFNEEILNNFWKHPVFLIVSASKNSSAY